LTPHFSGCDEPSEGLALQIVAEVMATIRKLKESGLSIVLVEQKKPHVLRMPFGNFRSPKRPCYYNSG
jgi:ABC-type branched-subunit amino acid transport system ATPase component